MMDSASMAAAAAAAAAAQQFHLKWNNHSLNTLSSFQHLLDTHTLVDVSLTCSNGKTVTAHRMVLAACSDYFYRLFKELPEKHPVIVFKDANEEIVRDLLLFMYRGEVEVQEAYLNDFLKFADTLQVKGLSQSDRDEAAAKAKMPVMPTVPAPAASIPGVVPPMAAAAAAAAAAGGPDIAKSYLAGLAKFPGLFPHLPNEPANDLLNSLSSPNLYRALQRKYQNQLAASGQQKLDPDSPVLKQMPFLKAAADLLPFYPPPPSSVDNDNDSTHSADHRHAASSPPTSNAGTRSCTPLTSGTQTNDNGHHSDSAMDTDASPAGSKDHKDADDIAMPMASANSSGTNASKAGRGRGSGQSSAASAAGAAGAAVASLEQQQQQQQQQQGGGKMVSTGRGSRLERMIAAEYKIISEFQDSAPQEGLPVMTPELMKSRRTHSLQLAIGEILHSRASVQSAATKYHIPRETLRRHYQRYLKAMGIQKPQGSSHPTSAASAASSTTSPAATSNTPPATTTTLRTGLATNNNATTPKSAAAAAASAVAQAGDDAGGQGSANGGFSSLLDIGQAYGIWNPDLDNSDFKAKLKDEAMRRAMTAAAAMAQVGQAAAAAGAAGAAGAGPAHHDDKDAANKQLVIDEDDDEIIEPGGNEDAEPPVGAVVNPIDASNKSSDGNHDEDDDDDDDELDVADDNDNKKKASAASAAAAAAAAAAASAAASSVGKAAAMETTA